MTLGEIRKLIEDATPGPWEATNDCIGGAWGGVGPGHIGEGYREKAQADGRFIAAARTLLPALLAAVEAAHETIEALHSYDPYTGAGGTEADALEARFRAALEALKLP